VSSVFDIIQENRPKRRYPTTSIHDVITQNPHGQISHTYRMPTNLTLTVSYVCDRKIDLGHYEHRVTK